MADQVNSHDHHGASAPGGFAQQLLRKVLAEATRDTSVAEARRLTQWAAELLLACPDGTAMDLPLFEQVIMRILHSAFAPARLSADVGGAIAHSLYEDEDCRRRVEQWARSLREAHP